MELTLKKLHLENFKGIKSLDIDFSKVTNISGANATGKTTIFDAYSWLLWDKDSLNRKQFGIKPFDKDGEFKHGLDSTVEGLIEVDGEEIKLKKVYFENWGKVRGKQEQEFKGNKTNYYINDVPILQKEYNERISKIIDEKEFNLLSNSLYFNAILDKKERREVLLSLIKDISKDDVIKADTSLKKLDLDNYSIDEIKAMAKASKTKTNKDIENLPSRIDELEKSKNTYNFESIEKNKKKLDKELEEVEKALSQASGSSEIIIKKNQEIQSYIDRQQEIKKEVDSRNYEKLKKLQKEFFDKKDEFEKKKREKRNQLEEASDSYYKKEKKVNSLDEKIKILTDKVKNSREKYINLANKKFDGSLNCPTCGRPYEEHKQNEIKESFNLNKSKKLEEIGTLGQKEADNLKALEKERLTLKELMKFEFIELQKIEKEYSEIGEFKEEMPTFISEEVPKEFEELQEKINQVKEQINSLDTVDKTPLLNEQKRIKNDLESITKTLGLKGQNEALDERIKAYMNEEKELAKEYEKQEEILFLCDEYLRVFTQLVSKKINSLFDYVSFKLFDTQVNGALIETCEVMVNGVPFSDLNNAAKINAGIDVINTLNKYLGKSVPIFVDNAESVNVIRNTESQLVKLIVSEDEELKIKGE